MPTGWHTHKDVCTTTKMSLVISLCYTPSGLGSYHTMQLGLPPPARGSSAQSAHFDGAMPYCLERDKTVKECFQCCTAARRALEEPIKGRQNPNLPATDKALELRHVSFVPQLVLLLLKALTSWHCTSSAGSVCTFRPFSTKTLSAASMKHKLGGAIPLDKFSQAKLSRYNKREVLQKEHQRKLNKLGKYKKLLHRLETQGKLPHSSLPARDNVSRCCGQEMLCVILQHEGCWLN
jgi:hypothetical protein